MRNIAVFIGNRADAGPLGPVVKAIEARGLTVHIVDQESVCGLGWYVTPSPDCLLLLGDRHELLDACHWAIYRQIPIAHIHGGETTLGSFDDRVRNAVSQLATLHFTAAECFSDKLRSMKVPGEIFTVGPPGLDDLETDEASEFGTGHFLVCLHPDTTRDREYNWRMAKETALALGRFAPRKIVLIEPNNDPGAKGVRAAFDEFLPMVQAFTLPRRRYLTALKNASVCIGNSSSFVIEAPALGTPTVLVGDRQKGRPLAWSVFPCKPDADAIEDAILQTTIQYRSDLPGPMPYGCGGASQKIAEILAAR